MPKKKSKRESQDNKKSQGNKKNHQSGKNCKSDKNSSNNKNNKNSKNNQNNKGIASLSYAELVVLSATLAYSIVEEMDEDDLTIFLGFLGLLLSEIEILVSQRELEGKSTDTSLEEEDVVEEENIDLE